MTTIDGQTINTMFEGIDDTYKDILVRSRRNEFFDVVAAISATNQPCLPRPELIFEAFRRTQYDRTRVILIGQDPYPTAGDAMGLAFATNAATTPRSLANIITALQKSNYQTPTSDISTWADRGVLMLNTALTVEIGKPDSHKNIWAAYITNVIEDILTRKAAESTEVILMLWGNKAHAVQSVVSAVNFATANRNPTNPIVHRVVTWCHPSPLANKGTPDTNRKHFANTDNFRKINRWLADANLPEIDWSTREELTKTTSQIPLDGADDAHASAKAAAPAPQ